MELTISFSTILMACLSFLGVYFLMPIVLIGRDFLVMLGIEKYILNDDFWSWLRIVNTDKAIFNEKYASKSAQVSFKDDGALYVVDGKEVDEISFQSFERGRKLHLNRINMIEPKIILRTNLISWAEKYFKLDSKLLEQIDEFSKSVYDSRTNSEKKRAYKEAPGEAGGGNQS